MSKALESVLEERKRQDKKWGEQNHHMSRYLSILIEEVGEFAEALNESMFDNGPEARKKGGFHNCRKEMVHVAAVALAMIECMDRNEDKVVE